MRGWAGSLLLVPLVTLLWGSWWEPGPRIDQRWLLPLVYGSWLALRALSRGSSGGASLARRLLALWHRLDPLVAATLIYAVLFRPPESLLAPGLIWLALLTIVAAFDLATGPVLVGLVTALLVFGVLVPRGFRAILLSKLAGTYETDLDHRMIPDGKEINSDSIRFRGTAEDMSEEEYVVLFLGDSFTYGLKLPYARTYPYQFERMAGESGCEPRVRAVNFGWISSSPLLSLRLLRDIGYRYKPDLVVYDLDMTDFHDDLRYEVALRRVDQLRFDPSAVTARLVTIYLPWARGALPALGAVIARLRWSDGDGGREGAFADLRFPGPKERRFTTGHPLERSRPGIELGVMKNLAEMYEFTTGVLGARMALVVYPRHYQLVQQNRSKRLGPHVKEPFRYFEEVESALPYPVISLLADFEQAGASPLYFSNDPHWNRHGAALAARAVLRELTTRSLVPCP